ncbi:vWA domain-containing protein [Nostoc sp.]|uniref:vWA domain-containing protein n=1 Tax=Nostoc sp. TaxID=1180 RepID=UPI002FF4D5AD
MNNENSSWIISASVLRLRMKSPFFATLALFARFVPSQQLPTAATDGKDIFFNPEYLLSLPTTQQDGLLLHEVLHAALLHVPRRGVREAELWNIAADIVVNGIISQQGVFELPPGRLREPKLEHLSVEEIYELLLKNTNDSVKLLHPDLLNEAPFDASSFSDVTNNDTRNQAGETQETGKTAHPNDFARPTAETSSTNSDSLSEARKAALETHWRNALQQAAVIARTVNQGLLPAGIERELGALTTAQINWRSYLWRYLVQTPTDFAGFDRRFIGRKLYLETLQAENVEVYVAVDTSGSIDNQQMWMFLGEVQGILSAYPHLKCELYYVDAEAYGPYKLNLNLTLPKPQGGGGTSFVPFFEKVAESWDGQTQGVCIYLTDGYGTFPDKVPELPVLWVVTPGGLTLEKFPFGEAVRLLSV